MDLIHLLIVLVVVLAIVALLLWGLNQLTLPPNVKVVIQVVVGVILLLWILSMVNGGGAFHIGKIGLASAPPTVMFV